MNLVLDAREGMEQLALDIERHRANGVAEEQFIGAVAVVLDHAEARNRQPERVEHLLADVHMTQTAVDHERVRQRRKLLVAVHIALHAAREHFAHGGVVVLIGQPLHLEALVVAFLRLSLLKYHHAGNDVRAGNVGNIEGFHPFRGGNGQHFSKKRQRRADPLFPAGDTLSFLKGIFAGQLHQTQIVAPLGDVELRPPPVLLFQQLGEQLAVVDLKGQQNPLGEMPRLR